MAENTIESARRDQRSHAVDVMLRSATIKTLTVTDQKFITDELQRLRRIEREVREVMPLIHALGLSPGPLMDALGMFPPPAVRVDDEPEER